MQFPVAQIVPHVRYGIGGELLVPPLLFCGIDATAIRGVPEDVDCGHARILPARIDELTTAAA